MKELLRTFLRRVLDKDAKDSVWDREDWNGSTEPGFYTTYELDMEKLDAAIDAFCAEFENNETTS